MIYGLKNPELTWSNQTRTIEFPLVCNWLACSRERRSGPNRMAKFKALVTRVSDNKAHLSYESAELGAPPRKHVLVRVQAVAQNPTDSTHPVVAQFFPGETDRKKSRAWIVMRLGRMPY